MNDSILRMEWLKQEFASFDYHEEMLREYWFAVDVLDRHWNNPKMASKEAQGQYAGSENPREWPGITAVMRTTGLHNLKQVSRPDVLARNEWKPGANAGWANTILYNFGAKGLGEILGDASETHAMPDALATQYGEHVNRATRMANNIRRTVENTWEKHSPDTILDEEFTGPINWPANWKEEITAALGISSDNSFLTVTNARCEAKQPCPRTGFWWTPAKQHSRRYFNQGGIMPDFPDSQYGATVWYWDQKQD